MNDTTLFELIYFFGACVGIFLSTVILLRQRSISNGLLSILLALFSFYLVEQSVYLSGDLRSFPHLMFATLPVTFLIGPLFFHFIRLNVLGSTRFRLIHLTHFLPFLYELVILSPFYWLSAERKLEIYQMQLNSTDNSFSFSLYFLGFIIYLVSTLGFLVASFHILRKTSYESSLKRTWLRRISFYFLIYLMLNIMALVIGIFSPDLLKGWQHFSLITLTLIILSIGYISYLHPEVIIVEEQQEKYVNSRLTSVQIGTYVDILRRHMKEERAYLNHRLTPGDLADSLGVTTNDLSRIFSEGMNTNFYRFVNEYRINHAKKLLHSAAYEHAKVLHVALDSGFSNKTSFLRNFKEMIGKTPSEYKSGTTHLSETLKT